MRLPVLIKRGRAAVLVINVTLVIEHMFQYSWDIYIYIKSPHTLALCMFQNNILKYIVIVVAWYFFTPNFNPCSLVLASSTILLLHIMQCAKKIKPKYLKKKSQKKSMDLLFRRTWAVNFIRPTTAWTPLQAISSARLILHPVSVRMMTN